MHFQALDWFILVGTIVVTAVIALYTRRYTRSVADFVVAGRCAGRYLIATAEGISMIGAISVVMMFEMYYASGFSTMWWSLMQLPIGITVAVTGWVVYRYRQTRVMTVAEFFERRYSRGFRVFAGLLAYLSGIINFGIFPAISTRFFMYFLGLPDHWFVFGMSVPMFPTLMALFLGISLAYVFLGGQVAILITDFAQGVMANAVFAVLIIFFLWTFSWDIVVETVAASDRGRALFDPMAGGAKDDFGFVFFLIGGAAMFFNSIAWQGRSGFNAAPRTPHEAKMGKALGAWRQLMNTAVMVILPIAVFVVLNHPSYATEAASINELISAVDNPTLQRQMTVPLALTELLPVGLLGLFAAMMFAAMITTDQPYLHSWGSILVQDVILPLRGRPLPPRVHIWLLRASILFVAIFAFLFSLLFQQTTYIVMFFQVTGAIFMGGAGAVIIGGLYWKRGTTAAAWSTMIFGSSFALFGIYATNYIDGFPLNGMHMFGLTMLFASTIYILVSLFGPRTDFNLDRILHRGDYADRLSGKAIATTGWRSLITEEFTRGDKIIYAAIILWTLGWFSVFVVGTSIALFTDIKLEVWAMIWHSFIYITLVASIITTIWFAIGGLRDTFEVFRMLSSPDRDDSDNGMVDESVPADVPEAGVVEAVAVVALDDK